MGAVLPLLPDVTVAVVAVVAGFALLSPPDAVFAGVLAVVATIVAGVDRRFYIIPDTASLALAVVGLTLAVWGAPSSEWLGLLSDAGARGLAAGATFWSLRALHRAWRGIEGLGFGDVKLAAAGAPWLAWGSLVPVLELAVVAALVGALIAARRAAEGPRLDDLVPFGVFLAPALWIGFVAERSGTLDWIWPFAGY